MAAKYHRSERSTPRRAALSHHSGGLHHTTHPTAKCQPVPPGRMLLQPMVIATLQGAVQRNKTETCQHAVLRPWTTCVVTVGAQNQPLWHQRRHSGCARSPFTAYHLLLAVGRPNKAKVRAAKHTPAEARSRERAANMPKHQVYAETTRRPRRSGQEPGAATCAVQTIPQSSLTLESCGFPGGQPGWGCPCAARLHATPLYKRWSVKHAIQSITH